MDCRWIEEARNIICVGRPGLGKTRILKALGRAACEKGFDALYVVTAKMLEDLQASLADGTYRRVLRRYERPSVLLCDEFGYEPFDARATNFLFRLISARHRKAPTVLATKQPQQLHCPIRKQRTTPTGSALQEEPRQAIQWTRSGPANRQRNHRH